LITKSFDFQPTTTETIFTTTSTTTTTTTTTTTESSSPLFSSEIELDGEIESQARPRKLSGTDEEEKAAASAAAKSSSNNNCTENQFVCLDGGCIDRYQRCDKITDCVDASDEIDCGKLVSFCLTIKHGSLFKRWLRVKQNYKLC
jgi:hypothetical protein